MAGETFTYKEIDEPCAALPDVCCGVSPPYGVRSWGFSFLDVCRGMLQNGPKPHVQNNCENQILFDIPAWDKEQFEMASSIKSFTLLSGWSKEAENALAEAIKVVIQDNPILAGTPCTDDVGNMFIQAGGNEDIAKLLHIVEGPTGTVIPESLEGRLKWLGTEMSPIFAPHSVMTFPEQVKNKSPLFRITVATLSGGYAVYCVELSHMIADGDTYYKCIELLDIAMDPVGRTPPGYKWVPPPKWIGFPEHLSAEDINCQVNGWKPKFVERLVAEGASEKWAPYAIYLANEAEIKNLKAEMTGQSGCKFLSSNDIITAALSEVVESNQLIMAMNMRKRADGIGNNLLGNYERLPAFPTKLAAAKPGFVRSLVNKSYYYEEGQYPKGQWEACSFGCISSWAGLAHLMTPPGTTVLAHCTAPSFVSGVAIELSIIYKADTRGTLAVLHNFGNFDGFAERVEQSKLYKRVFGLKN